MTQAKATRAMMVLICATVGCQTTPMGPPSSASEPATDASRRVDDGAPTTREAPPVATTAAREPSDDAASDEGPADQPSTEPKAPSLSVAQSDAEAESAMAEKMAREGKRGCAGTSHLIDAAGEVTRCYPYRCRDDACLTRCKTTADCVPSAKPGEDVVLKGWPILCGGHVPPSSGQTAECLPLPPQQVHRGR